MTEPLENPPQPETPPKLEEGDSRSVITIKAPSPENIWAEIVVVLNYLTRLSLPLKEEPKPRLVRKAMGWFPLVGAGIGIFGACLDWVMTQIGLPGIITATFAVISMLWLTRALHEEEFASLVNQYGQTIDKEQKTGWLREERSVSYGTLGVILVIIMKIGAIASLSSSDLVFQGLLVSACWSRALMVVAAAWLRPIDGDPVATYFQQPPALRVLLAVIVGAVLTFLALGEDSGVALLTGAGAGLIVAIVGANHVRGYNGPLLGTLQQVVEITVLGTLLAIQ